MRSAAKRGVGKADSRTAQVASALTCLAIERGPSAKMPTVQEICKTYDASVSTVVGALADLEERNIIYRRQGSGIFVSDRIFRKNVALLVSSSVFNWRVDNPFWDVLWGHYHGIADARARRGIGAYTFHVVGSESGEMLPIDDQLKRMMRTEQISGALAMGLDLPTYQWLQALNVPVVSFAGHGANQVTLNHYLMIERGVEALAQRGAKNILLWMPHNHALNASQNDPIIRDTTSQTHAEHTRIFLDALQRHGLEPVRQPAWTCPETDRKPSTLPEQGVGLAHRLLVEYKPGEIDGILITDDLVAIGAMSCLVTQPKLSRIKIASHANRGVPVLYIVAERMALLEFDPKEIILQMLALLDRLIDDDTQNSSIAEVEPKLILGQRF